MALPLRVWYSLPAFSRRIDTATLHGGLLALAINWSWRELENV